MALQNLSFQSALPINESLTILSQTLQFQPATGMNELLSNLGPSSTPPCSLDAVAAITMTGSAVTIDLTSLATSYGTTMNANTKKTQFVKLQNPSTNSHTIAIAPGASNGYNLFGASFLINLLPGQSILANLNNASPTVGSGAKNISATGTNTEILNIAVVAG